MKKEPLRSNDIRELNEKLILDLIRNRKEVSQSDIVSITGLKAPSVFRIFTDLERRGLIKPLEMEKTIPGKRGRKPVFYGLEPTARYAIGVDFFSGFASIIVLDFTSTSVYQRTRTYAKDMDADQVISNLMELIWESVQKAGIPWEKVLGVGVGAPGVIDLSKGRILHFAGIKGMQNYDLQAKMEQALDVPVYIHNNSSLIAIGEYRYGKAKGAASLLLILIRAGVGGAFIHDGKIFVNRNRSALEIGHISLDQWGRPCTCGARGCLETYLSEDAIISDIRRHTNVSSLADIEEALQGNDPVVQDNLMEKARMLAQGIRSLSAIFSPEVCLLMTRSDTLSAFLAEGVRGFLVEMNQHAQSLDHGVEVEILADQFDPLLAGRSACDLVFDRFFRTETQV